jgi:hypothetical protein
VLAQFAAIGLILILFGAVQKKLFKWHTGFGGEPGTDGWSYDTMRVVVNRVMATTALGQRAVENVFHPGSPR